MEVRYERDLSHAYLVLPAKEEEGYERRMVLENRIRGFVPVQLRPGKGSGELYYCIAAQISLEEYLGHTPLSAAFLKQLIFSLCRAMDCLEEYLLCQDFLLLQPETIFLREDPGPEAKPDGSGLEGAEVSWQFFLCIYPDERQDTKEDLRQLMKYLMGKTDRSDETCAALCYRLYGLLQKDNFCMGEFMELLEQSGPGPQPLEPEKKNWAKHLFAGRRNSGIIKSIRH